MTQPNRGYPLPRQPICQTTSSDSGWSHRKEVLDAAPPIRQVQEREREGCAQGHARKNRHTVRPVQDEREHERRSKSDVLTPAGLREGGRSDNHCGGGKLGKIISRAGTRNQQSDGDDEDFVLSARVPVLNQTLVPDAPDANALLPVAQSVRVLDAPGVHGDYLALTGEPSPLSGEKRSLSVPMVNDPGTAWEYGVNTD